MDNKRKSTENGKLNISDKKASPYRTSDSLGYERVRHGNAGNYGTRSVKKAQEEKTENVIKLFPRPTEADKHRNIEKKRKAERVRKEQLKKISVFAIAVIAVIALIFMTPLFNIKEIRLSGNDTVTKDIINAKVGGLVGANLFGTSTSKVKERMNEIPQISDVEVKKAIFPARLELNITERHPAGYVVSGNDTLILDSDLTIIDDASVFDCDHLPSISGISVSSYEMNKELEIKSKEKKEILKELLKAFESTGITESVKYVSIDDLTSITFNYDNRLDVICGSQLQLDRKIRMFAESIRTSTFDESSIGTIDLSVPGTAVYNP